MSNLKRRLTGQILFELLVTPFTVIPTALGVGFGLLSFIIPPLSLFAFIGIGCGFAAMVANVAMNSGDVSKRAAKRLEQDDRRRREQRLDELDRRLVADRDPRSQQHLRDLRQMYFSFLDDLKAGKIKATVSQQILDRIDEIFETCVSSLNHAYNLWEQSRKMSDTIRTKVEENRNKILEDVGNQSTNMFDILSEVRALGLKSDTANLRDLQVRLESDLEVARRLLRLHI